MRYLDMHRGSPVGHQIDFNERTGGIDMGDLGTEVIAAVTLMFDLQKCGRTNTRADLASCALSAGKSMGNSPR